MATSSSSSSFMNFCVKLSISHHHHHHHHHLLVVLVFLISSFPTPSEQATDDFIYGGCSQQKYAPGSPFESNLNSLLTSLVNSAAFTTYNNFTINTAGPDIVYGLFQCRGDLSTPDCSRCVSRAVSQLGILCVDSAGGALQLQGCLVKYDKTAFLGVEDKTVVLKKCGPSVGFDSDVVGRRDAVLAGLASGGGSYRVGGSGPVQGVAQCVGDLSPGECQDCVAEAVSGLRANCGTAVSGDMFLVKCYVRYSAPGGGGGYANSDHSDDDDDIEKPLAITIGLLAGVAVLVVFLSFLRKAFDGKGGK